MKYKNSISYKNKFQLKLNTRIENLYNVGDAYKQYLNKLGIYNIRDLLFHFPSKYDDLSEVKPIIEVKPGQSATLKAKLISITSRRSRNKRMTITEAIVSDDSSTLKVIFFNQAYVERFLKIGDNLVLAGKVDYRPYFGKYLSNPVFEKTTTPLSAHLGRIVPRYPETRGISSKWLRNMIKPLLKFASDLPDPLPAQIKERLDLIDYDEAIRQIHFPDFKQSLKVAIRRLAFDELFLIALRSELSRYKFKSLKAQKIIFRQKEVNLFVKSLPFKLTSCQRRASWEIIMDLGKEKPMNRLLNGDVGSGKTVVAAIASFCIFLENKQTAIMAPTEVLAYQHYQNFIKFFKNYDIEIELLTNSYRISSKKKRVKKDKNKYLTSDIIIGTHALIQKGIKFKNLALAVIDEQHRFGVKQRAQIKKENDKKYTPHLLSMTATPIPRTLSLALYGDLDISILDEYPAERQKIKTYLVPPAKRAKAYNFIRNEVKKGRQVFVICPLIEKKESKNISTVFDFDNRRAAIEEYNKLKNSIFPDLKIGLLHGRMKSIDKEEIMKLFKDNKINILVSTSVVEVGVDIPNATVMMIEGAERFGLSQLHQFRGRVGRSKFKSYCFLFTESWQDEIKTRLEVIASTNDGFKIAEADLKLRGPGEVYGEKQHGIFNLHFASPFDYRMINEAKTEAKKLIALDPTLKSWPRLITKLKKFEKQTHLE